MVHREAAEGAKTDDDGFHRRGAEGAENAQRTVLWVEGCLLPSAATLCESSVLSASLR